MATPDFTLYWERLLVLRARLQRDMNQMEDNALNKDHAKTTSIAHRPLLVANQRGHPLDVEVDEILAVLFADRDVVAAADCLDLLRGRLLLPYD